MEREEITEELKPGDIVVFVEEGEENELKYFKPKEIVVKISSYKTHSEDSDAWVDLGEEPQKDILGDSWQRCKKICLGQPGKTDGYHFFKPTEEDLKGVVYGN